MKIDTQINMLADKYLTNNQQQNSDFKTWLKTGDAYYWQHQDKLQHSCLSFEASMIVAEKSVPEFNETPFLNETDKFIVQNTNNFVESRNLKNVATFSIQFTTPSEVNTLPIATEQVKQLTTASCAQSYTNAEKSSILRELPAIYKTQRFDFLLKNHYLHVRDQQAELTLNLKDISPTEQKNLIQLIKEQLKNKGINLNKLIINGVHHD